LSRAPDARELVLYLPDRLVVVDHARGLSVEHAYDFVVDGVSTARLPREGELLPAPRLRPPAPPASDHAPGAFEASVARAQEAFVAGELFEVVLSQTFTRPASAPPSTLFRRLCAANPSPYGFFLSLGQGEQLVGASPEMFVRVEG